MFVYAIQKIQKAIFPIFRLDQIDQNQIKINVVGTGFFISTNGNFVTVAHVFDNRTDKTKFLYFGKLPENLEQPQIEIEEIARDDNKDILIGRVKKKTPDFVNLSKVSPNVGRTVCISGYPLAQIAKNQLGGLEFGGVRRYFQPSFVLDHIAVPSSNGLGKIRTHIGFLVRDVGFFGMSGGPVFDTGGTVLGVQGSVTSPRVSEGSDGRKIIVENAVVINSSLVLNFIKEHRIRIN